MYLFSQAQIVRNERIEIPYEMRAALGYHEGCLIYCSHASSASSSLRNQILVSSIPFERREDLWNLNVCFKDRPGILTELTDFLTKFHLDIWNCYLATRDQHREVVVNLDFDAQLYQSQFDMSSTGRKASPHSWPQELYARIVCRFIEDVALRPDGKPNIYIKRNYLLARSVKGLEHRERSEMQGGNIQVPKGMIDPIRQEFVGYHGEEWASRVEKERGDLLAMLVADPEFRSLTATLFYPHTGYLHVRVEARNQVGTIAAIAKAFFDSGFNILQAYTRNLHAAERSLTDFLLYFPVPRGTFRDDGKLRKLVRDLFHDRLLRKIDCKVSFPPSSKKQGKKNGVSSRAAL